MAASARIFALALLMRTATGDLAPGTTAAGAVSVTWRRGVFRFENSAAADLITQADIGKLCFIVDDCTVARTNGSARRPRAGVVEDVDAIGVWVRLDEALTGALA